MALPTNRNEFKEYCLRKLGKPVLKINISDEQIEDRIDEALKYYYDYHFDGSEKIYYKHLVTAQDKANKYMTLPENILGVVNLFPIGTGIGTNNIFNIRYQIALNDLYTLTSVSMVPYYMAMTHIQLLEQLLVGQQPLRYNRHTNKLFIDMDWDRVNEGEYLLVEAYEVINPDIYTDAWADRWLLRYATELIKKQWGSHLKKFGNVKMPDGTTFNGKEIYQEAHEEIEKLEAEMINSYSLPANMMIG
jgi:hypothetical protein